MLGKFTHLVYKISSAEDVINRLSPEGRELINDDLADYLDLARPTIPLDVPVVLEITGQKVTPAQKQAMIRALSAHYQIRLDEINDIIRRCLIKTFWFILCLLVSSILIFLCNNSLSEVLVQYLYLPFWFFGYRAITFPLLDLQPMRRERKRLEHFASMKVLFTEQQADEALSDYEKESAEFGTLSTSVLDAFCGSDREKLSLVCVAHDLEDVLNPASTPGREVMSADLAYYLEQTEHFALRKSSVDLTIQGDQFTPDQQVSVEAAIRHYYGLCCKQVEQDGALLFRKIVLFIAGVLISSVVLFCVGSMVDTAFHELLIIVLWFFGDYLIEFIILENLVLRRCQYVYESMENLTLSFE